MAKDTTIGGRELKPSTLMMGHGYDPVLSEGSLKPPIFLTSTFAFPSAADGPPLSAFNHELNSNLYSGASTGIAVTAIDTDLPVPSERSHMMLGSKASWVPVQAGPDDRRFDEYPDESLADWHRRLGLEDSDA